MSRDQDDMFNQAPHGSEYGSWRTAIKVLAVLAVIAFAYTAITGWPTSNIPETKDTPASVVRK